MAIGNLSIKNYVGVNCRSIGCFRLGWPMRVDADFFCQPLEQLRVDKKDVCCNFGLYVACLLVC